MKKKSLLIIAMLTFAAILPLFAFRANAVLSAGPNQTAYPGQTVVFNGTTTDDSKLITLVTWNFGDNVTVNGTNAGLLSTTHVYNTTGTFNVTLFVKFDAPLSKNETAVAIIDVVTNLPPVANAGPDKTVEQTSLLGADVTLNGTASSDPLNDTLTYFWNWTGGNATGATPTALFPPGNTTVTLTVSDGQLNATDTVNIIVRDTTAPTVTTSPNTTVEVGKSVNLNGLATDAVSTRFNFTWSEGTTILRTDNNVTNTNLVYSSNSTGNHTLTLKATDYAGNTGTANVTVTVVTTPVTPSAPTVADTTPPTLTVTAAPSSIWPPNHKYVTVKITATAHDNTDPSPKIAFVSMASNEADNARGSGNTANDIVKVDDFTFNIRAERSGPGSGRTYTITYKATDASGNTATASAIVTVPKNQ
jgi:PKD domain